MTTDDELQESVERGEANSGPDAIAYAKVFDMLAHENAHPLSSTFTNRVMNRISVKKKRVACMVDCLILIPAILVVIGSGGYCISVTNFKFDFGFLNVMSKYFGLALFCAGLLVILHVVEKKILSRPDTNHPA